MLKDLRHGLRTLLQAKGWTTVVVLSLALGIGANTALFSAVNALLLAKVTASDPDSLVRLKWIGPNDMVTSSSDYGSSGLAASGAAVRATFSYALFQQFVAGNQTMTDLLACAPFGRMNVVVNGHADLANGFIATGNYFQMLGATTRVGRTFTPDDDREGAAPVAVISSRFWRSRFGSDASIVGKPVEINNVPVTIVGVTTAEFLGIQQSAQEPPDVTVPLALDSRLNPQGVPGGGARLTKPTYWWLQVMGRLKPDATAAQAQAGLDGILQRVSRQGFDEHLASLSDEERSTADIRRRSAVPRLRVDSGSRGIYDATETDTRALAILSGVVVLVLLIVCANVANLLLSRATARRKEVSVRLSLGATRNRLIRQFLTESVLLATIGGSLGLVIGYWGKQLLPGTLGQATPIDWRLVAFVVGVTGLTAIVFGTAPALRATGVNVNAALKDQSRSVVASRSWLTRGLLVAQVSISLVLLIGAGLFLRTVQNLRYVDVGFNAQNLVLFRVNPQLNRYDAKRTQGLYQEMLARLAAVPGVQAVGFSQPALLSGSVNTSSIFIEGRSYRLDARDSIHRLVVSSNFLETMGMSLLVGRGFTEADHETAPKVAIVNAAAAQKYFPNENPIGQHFGSSAEQAGQTEIIGVLRDTKYDSVREAAPPTMYVSQTQFSANSPSFAVRTAGEPMSLVGALREAVRQIDPNLPLTNVSTQMEMVEQRFEQERLFANAYAIFGGVALALAAIGLFGLMSYSVARRTSEIGIRMALGAQQRSVLLLVLGESMILVAIGVVVGTVAAIGAGRLVASQLFGIEATDVATMAVATMVMVSVATVAGYLPARRASRVDPMVALRDE